VRAGKTLCVSRIDIFDDANNLAAIAIVTYIRL
jgi:acyl-coenzyme A thioesterase PaaI-like protein